jgi:hypothetical protein
MTILGYKYNTIEEARIARQQVSDYFGFVPTQENVIKYLVDFSEAVLDFPVFWYIEYIDELGSSLGIPYEFEVTEDPNF